MYRLSPRHPERQRIGFDVEAILLAGVHSWGGCPLERAICRPLMPLADKPLIAHALGWLRDSGLTTARICANSDTQALWNRLGEGANLGITLEYYEDVMPRGPAGCVRDAVENSRSETFLVVEGTLVPQIDLAKLLSTHRRSGAVVTMTVRDMPGNGPGTVRDWTPVGIYVFDRSVLEHIPSSGYQDIKETLIPRLHAGGQRVVIFPVDSRSSPRVSGVPSYLAVSKWAVEQMARDERLPAGYRRIGDACVHETSTIDPTAQLFGPVLIGRGTTIGEGVVVAGAAAIGEHCRVEAGAAISRSVIWNECAIGPGAVVDHCILTDRAKITAATAIRNAVCSQTQPGPAARKLDLRTWPAQWQRKLHRPGPSTGAGTISSLPDVQVQTPRKADVRQLKRTGKIS